MDNLPEIRTERLLTRAWRTDDAGRLAVLYSTPALMQYLGDGRVTPAERIPRIIEYRIRVLQENRFCYWAVEHLADRVVIGHCGISFSDELGGHELGYLISDYYWHNGYATEAAAGVLRYAFEELALPRVLAYSRPENVGSVRVMQKLGMQFVESRELHGHQNVVYAAERPGNL